VISGIKYTFDVASDSRSRQAPGLISISPTDFQFEYGAGIQFFFPYFILSPEVKFSYGLSNVHARDEQLIYSSVIDRMNSRMIMFSLHFEGGGLGGRKF
jgi:hypothetical protein